MVSLNAHLLMSFYNGRWANTYMYHLCNIRNVMITCIQIRHDVQDDSLSKEILIISLKNNPWTLLNKYQLTVFPKFDHLLAQIKRQQRAIKKT